MRDGGGIGVTRVDEIVTLNAGRDRGHKQESGALLLAPCFADRLANVLAGTIPSWVLGRLEYLATRIGRNGDADMPRRDTIRLKRDSARRLVAACRVHVFYGVRMKLAQELAHTDRISLLACDEARNIRRGYAIERTVDLFGHHIVDWSWGRAGTAGQGRRLSFERSEDAVRFVRELLRRRDTAERRIGVRYRQIAPNSAPSAPANRPAAPGLLRNEVVRDLRYRLMRYALGVNAAGLDMVEIVTWGGCSKEVEVILKGAGNPQRAAPVPVRLTLDEAIALTDLLEDGAPRAVFQGNGAARRRNGSQTPVAPRSLRHG